MDRYGQMSLKSLFLWMKELGVSQAEFAARMRGPRPSVSKTPYGEIDITFLDEA